MISQRLRGVKEDGEAIEEEGFMPKLKQAFGDVGIAIEDQNGELRSTYDILNDLAGKWDQLSSKQRQYLGEKAAGNRQVKTLNAIMSNWDVVQDTIQKANEATGEAAQGNEKYLDSIEGRVTQFKSAFQDLARTTIDSGFVKSLVSIGTGFINITKNAGGLVPVATTLLGIITAFKGVKIAESIGKIAGSIKTLVSSLAGAGGLSGILSTGWVGIAIAAVGAIAMIANAIKNSSKSLKESATAAKQNFSDQQTKVESLNSELENTQKLINDLSGKGNLTVVEEAELKRLQETNGQLERQITLEKARLEITQRGAREANSKAGREYNAQNIKKGANNAIQSGVATFGSDRMASIFGEEILDLNGRLGGISNEKQFEVYSKTLLEAKKKYNQVYEEFLSTNKNDEKHLQELQDEMDKYSSFSKEAENWLNTYLSELETYTEGISRVENPAVGSLDEYFNHLIDLRESVADLLSTSYAINMSPSDQSNLVLSKYTEAADKAKELVDTVGQITVEDLGDKVFSEMVAKFEELGWSIEDVAQHLTEFYTIANDGAQTHTSVDSLIEKNFLATESYKNLTAAMSEQQKAGAISLETYKQLINDKEGLPGIANYLTLTAEGFALNTDALYDYIKAQTDDQKLKALEQIQDKQKAIEELGDKYEKLVTWEEQVENASQQEALQGEIDQLTAYIRSLDAASDALARYKAAKSTPNEDEDYNTGQEAFKDIQEGWKSGKVGTDDYQEAMRFMLGGAYGTTLTGKQAKDAATKLGNRYFKDEKTGTKNFLSDLEKTDLVTKDKNGNLSLKEGTTLKQVAESLSEVTGNAEMSESAIESLFKLLNTYSEGDKFDFPEVITPEEAAKIEENKKKLQELGDAETEIKDKMAEVSEQIDNAEPGQDTSKLEKQYQDLESALQSVQEEKEAIEEGTEVDVDSMSIEEATTKLQELETVIVTLTGNGVKVPVTITGMYTSILTNLENRLKTIEEKGSKPEITAKDKTKEGIDEAKDSLDGIEDKEIDIKTKGVPQLETTLALIGFTLGLLDTEKTIRIIAQNETKNGVNNAINKLRELNKYREIVSKIIASDGFSRIVGLATEAYNLLIPSEKTTELKAKDSTSTGISKAKTSIETFLENTFNAIIAATPSGLDEAGGAIDEIANKERTAWITVKERPEQKSPTEVQNDLNSFWETYSEMLQYGPNAVGKYMESLFGNGNVDLKNRPTIPASMLSDVGWENVGDSSEYATLFSRDYRLGENGEIGIIVTPITKDGDPLEPDSFEEYINGLIVGPDGTITPESDPLGLVVSQFNLDNIPEELRDGYMTSLADLLHRMQESYYGDVDLNDIVEPTDVDVQVEAEDGSGSKIVEEVQNDVDSESPVEIPTEAKPTEPEPTSSSTNVQPTSTDQTVNLHFKADDGGSGAIEEVQENADANPVEIEFTQKDADSLDAHVRESTNIGFDTGAIDEAYELRDAYQELRDAQAKLDSTDPGDTAAYDEASTNLSSAASNFKTAYDNLSNALGGIPNVEVDADTSSALNKIKQIDDAAKKPITKKVTIQTSGVLPYATGTKGAPKGPALVDDGGGAELIEHVSRGTYELGTDNGPRMTYLDKGDVVHTAKETKTILSRMAKVGGFFRYGLNKGKSIIGNAFAKGISGSISLENINRVLNSARSGKSSSVTKSKGKGLSSKKLSAWAEKLFDWAEVRLERLKTITNSWLLSASEAIGYIAKNNELASAIRSVEDEIEATSKAYDLYIKQADTVAQKAKLSNDIVQKIQNGTIEIASYKKEVQEKIKLYQEWYNKALNCVDALSDLREQEKELARQRLDNIIDHYTNRVNRLDNVVRQRESELELATAEGTEIHASDYDKSIDATTQKLKELVEERNTLEIEMEQLMSQGFIEKESDEWYEYQGKLDDVTNAITETKTAIIELADTANEVNITKLGYQLDALTNSAAAATGMMDLHSAQGLDELPDAYAELIVNGMQQIEILERENEGYREQQKNLDVLSEKYQDLESKIQSNLSAINSMKVSQEGWNDSVLELKIGQLEKFRDKLSKTNDQYERQKQLQEAIEDLQRAQDQRTNKVFKEGIGFVFEADQDALKDAQENLESVIQDQLISRIDDLIDALNEEKNNTNVYDAQGNLLGTEYVLPQLDSLSQILSDYYNNNTVPLYSGLKGSLYDQIIEGATSNKSMQFTFGDINLSEVNDVETLGAAIVDLLPNAILQAINKK